LSEEVPFLSSGKLVEDYRLLVRYFKKCKSIGLDCSPLLPASQTLLEIKQMVEKKRVNFNEVLDFVRGKLSTDVHCSILVDAFEETYGVRASCEEAKNQLIKQLAGWYIEILDTLGYVKIKYAWKP